MLDKIRAAKQGSIAVIYQEIEFEAPLTLFRKLSNSGKSRNSFYADFKEEGKVVMSHSPALKISGRGEDFEIKYLNNAGRKMANALRGSFKFCAKAVHGKNAITGKISPLKNTLSQEQRAKENGHADVIRAVLGKFKISNEEAIKPGIFGFVSSGFMDYLEQMPKNHQTAIEKDYEFYLADNFIYVDSNEKKAYAAVAALVSDNKYERLYSECMKQIANMQKQLKKKMPAAKKGKKKPIEVSCDKSKEEFMKSVNSAKASIAEGRSFGVRLSKLFKSNYNAEPLEIYSSLSQAYDGKSSFYLNGEDACIACIAGHPSIRIAAGEMEMEFSSRGPRSSGGSKISKEIMLRKDLVSLRRHVLILDAMHSYSSAVLEKDSKSISKSFEILHKPSIGYGSAIKGRLKEGIDMLSVMSTFLGVSAGIPMQEAEKSLRKEEATGRGIFGGIFAFISLNDFALAHFAENYVSLKKNSAYFRGFADISPMTDGEKAFEESEKTGQEILDTITRAGGSK